MPPDSLESTREQHGCCGHARWTHPCNRLTCDRSFHRPVLEIESGSWQLVDPGRHLAAALYDPLQRSTSAPTIRLGAYSEATRNSWVSRPVDSEFGLFRVRSRRQAHRQCGSRLISYQLRPPDFDQRHNIRPERIADRLPQLLTYSHSCAIQKSPPGAAVWKT